MPQCSTTVVGSGGGSCAPSPARQKIQNIKQKTINLTTDHKLLPKQQNTTDYRITMHAVTLQ